MHRSKLRRGAAVVALCAAACCAPAAAQAPAAAPTPPPAAASAPASPPSPVPAPGPAETITFKNFLAEVAAGNLDYAAARYNVPIAQAQLAAAQTSPNPALTLGTGGHDITDSVNQKEPANNEIGLAETIETGGKRGRRVAVARANLAQAAATLEDFFRNLRANAATAYVDALTKRREADEKLRSTEALDQLVDANRKRLEVGDIGEIDVTQSRVDAQQSRADYLAAVSDARLAVLTLEQLLGRRRPLGTLAPIGSLDGPARDFDQEALIAKALETRPDVVAARKALDSANASIAVAKALVVPDLGVSFNYQDNERSANVIAPAPAFSSIGLSVTVNLPIWNRYRGELLQAQATARQTATNLEVAELHARVDILQALARYRLANERARQFQGGAIDDAAEVYKAKLFSYEHGASTLLDVLNARTSENAVRLAYLDALDERAEALINVEQAAGIWDLDF